MQAGYNTAAALSAAFTIIPLLLGIAILERCAAPRQFCNAEVPAGLGGHRRIGPDHWPGLDLAHVLIAISAFFPSCSTEIF